MHPRKRAMIGFFAIGLGAAAYTAVSINHERIQHQEARYQQMVTMAMQQMPDTPIQQVDASIAGVSVPDGQLPLDATPTPGYLPEPGSVRPKIIMKPTAGSMPIRPRYSIIIERTTESVKPTGDPVWKVALVDNNGKQIDALKALSGRAAKQTANRHQSGNKSPLPAGVYAIDTYGIGRGPFGDPELGHGYWVPITPLFNTGRSALGFHQDPSWGKTNGESGTSGCVGLESPEATAKLVDWIRTYQINKVIVAS